MSRRPALGSFVIAFVSSVALASAVGCSDRTRCKLNGICTTEPKKASPSAPGCTAYEPLCIGSDPVCTVDDRGCRVCTCQGRVDNRPAATSNVPGTGLPPRD